MERRDFRGGANQEHHMDREEGGLKMKMTMIHIYFSLNAWGESAL